MSFANFKLPRLLYVGDVPVESSYHGSALIYRLLQNYPPEKLRILEGNLRHSLPARRLAGVKYDSITVGWRRPLHTRLTRWAHLAYSWAAPGKVDAVEKSLDAFQPEAVLTVAHDFLWLTAARYARKHSLPLHLICHDDWPKLAPVPAPFRGWLEKQFQRVYLQAASRLCVSPYMAEAYERRYGGRGTVLYPSRAADAVCFDAPPARLLSANKKLTVAFAGNICTYEYAEALRLLGQCLEKNGGCLWLFGPVTANTASRYRLNRSNIKIGGMLTSAELINRLRAEVDVLFIPMSFSHLDREQSALSFPSKLTDYTAVGLPLLIYGPGYCSAVRWARENPEVAEIVTEQSSLALEMAINRLCEPEHRAVLAENALRNGGRFFSHAAADRILNLALSSHTFNP